MMPTPSIIQMFVAFWLGCVATAVVAQDADLHAGRRVALVIGNGAYVHASPLQNPVGDARLIASRLETLGFEVLLRTDLDRRGFIVALSDFKKALKGSETGGFFYAGHGVQVDGRNYLIPVEVGLESKEFLSLEAIDVNLITRTLNEASRTTLIFLDACRNDPFDSTRGSDSATRGLARVSADRNTMISFAAAPGNVALDRVAGLATNNSPFSTALDRHLGAPGDTISRTMIKVRRDVLEMTGGRQVPWENSSLVDEVVLKVALPEPEGQSMSADDMWAWVQDTADPVLLERFVERFSDSRQAVVARDRIASLRAAENAARAEAERQALEAERLILEAEEEERRRLAFFTEPAPPEIRGRLQDCADCPEMVEVAGTELLFGTPETILRAQSDERPARRVTFGAPILISETETSQAEFAQFVKATGYNWPEACMITGDNDKLPRAGSRLTDVQLGADLPVVCVSWKDAQAYAGWMSEKTGKSYRLLTEVEFEYLAEAFHFNTGMEGILGGSDVCKMANIADLGSPFSWRNFGCTDTLGRGVFPVRALEPDSFGLHHLLGNVWEWMENCYAETPEVAVERALQPRGSACDRQAIRGGGWSDPLTSLRTSNRSWEAPDYRSDILGFRVMRQN